MNGLLTRLANLFPLWVFIGGVFALIHPSLFTWYNNQMIVWGLAVIMLGMGITLDIEDFKKVFKMPSAIAAGFVAQYSIMPFLGWSIAKLLNLDTAFAVGLIIVACCPGGTASNVVTFIARANVALSVLMTTCSTLAAVIMTPLLTKWLAGAYVPVDALALLLDTARVILLPVTLGLFLHHTTPRLVKAVLPAAPLVSVIFITLICASIIGRNSEYILHSGGKLILAVFLLHSGGFALGYLFAALLGYDKIIRRTISIEVGMQNSGLGTVLAMNNFPQLPSAPVPCAISATFHSIIGSFLAGIWRLRTPENPQQGNKDNSNK